MPVQEDEEIEEQADDPPVQHALASGTVPTSATITIPGVGAFPVPPSAKLPVHYTDSTKANTIKGRLADASGRGWYLKLSTGNMYFWCRMPRVKKKAVGFNMAMRTDHATPTMFTIASATNSMQRMLDASAYASTDMEQAIDKCGRNTGARASQGGVMKKFFKDLLDGKLGALPSPLGDITRENAQWAVQVSDASALSASKYARLDNCEWLHLRGHGLGGREEPANLVAGSHGANTEMAAIEIVLQQLGPTMSGLGYDVRAVCVQGSLVAQVVHMQIVLNGTPVFSHEIHAQCAKYPEIFYKQLQDEVLNRILSNGVRGREIKFAPGGLLATSS